MSEDRETYGDMSVDDEDQLQPGDTLDDRDLEDVLDRGYSPPDRRAQGLRRLPDRGRAPPGRVPRREARRGGARHRPLRRGGGDDSDHEDENALDEQLGLDEADARTGRLVAPDEGLGEDVDKQEIAYDVGIDGAGASAEEAAMHITREPEPEPFEG